VEGKVDPVADVATIQTELCLRDLDTATKRLDKARRASKGGDAMEKVAVTLCERLVPHLDAMKPARSFKLDGEKEEVVLRELSLLTAKPTFYVANVDEGSLGKLDKNPHYQAMVRLAAEELTPIVSICAHLEAQISELEPADRPDFLASAGLKEPGLNEVIRTGYRLLGLITFLTAGEDECRAWTLKKGLPAPKAAAVIHTDFERGFIRAEVIRWEDLVALGSEAKCREQGKLRVEGKDYIVQDGDVVHFRFNV
jgi:GTP-binding protein YchF